MPAGVELIEERVKEFDPDGNKIVTESGKPVLYDFLIVATGIKLDYDSISGMDVNQIGKNGIGSVYHSPAGAEATWQAMSQFTQTGGVGLILRPATEMKCADAPLKYTFITDDRLRCAGNRGKADLIYDANNKALFGVPIVSEKVRMLFKGRGVKVDYDSVLQSIDLGKRIAPVTTPDGKPPPTYATTSSPYEGHPPPRGPQDSGNHRGVGAFCRRSRRQGAASPDRRRQTGAGPRRRCPEKRHVRELGSVRSASNRRVLVFVMARHRGIRRRRVMAYA